MKKLFLFVYKAKQKRSHTQKLSTNSQYLSTTLYQRPPPGLPLFPPGMLLFPPPVPPL